MKTAEEILKEHQAANALESKEYLSGYVHDKVLSAMQEYAKQETYEFNRFLYTNNWEPYFNGNYVDGIGGEKTHEELYTEYLTSKNK